MKVVRVYFPDLSCKAYTVPESITGEELFQKVAQSIDLMQYRRFGLFQVKDDEVKPLDPDYKPVVIMSLWPAIDHEQKMINYFLFQKDPFAIAPDELDDPVAIKLLYWQAKRDVLESKHSDWVDEGTCIALAGIQMQATYGDHKPDIHSSGFLKDEQLRRFIPSDLFDSKEEGEWEAAIFEEHAKHLGGSTTDMMLKYLSYFDAFKVEEESAEAGEDEED